MSGVQLVIESPGVLPLDPWVGQVKRAVEALPVGHVFSLSDLYPLVGDPPRSSLAGAAAKSIGPLVEYVAHRRSVRAARRGGIEAIWRRAA